MASQIISPLTRGHSYCLLGATLKNLEQCSLKGAPRGWDNVMTHGSSTQTHTIHGSSYAPTFTWQPASNSLSGTHEAKP